jgi:hypothetical protein
VPWVSWWVGRGAWLFLSGEKMGSEENYASAFGGYIEQTVTRQNHGSQVPGGCGCPLPTLTSTVSISDAARLLMEEGDTLQQEEHE